MSSILKALKKLESEKSQRDELSTAVASDILRSSRERKRHRALQVAVGGVVVALCAAGGYLFAIRTAGVRAVQPDNTQWVLPPSPPTESRSSVTESSVASTPLPPSVGTISPRDLPRLSGIIYHPDPQDRLAIINDLPVMEGTLVAEFEIRTIQPDHVVLGRSGSEYVLHLDQ